MGEPPLGRRSGLRPTLGGWSGRRWPRGAGAAVAAGAMAVPQDAQKRCARPSLGTARGAMDRLGADRLAALGAKACPGSVVEAARVAMPSRRRHRCAARCAELRACRLANFGSWGR